ncbi:hypothetical protein VTN77DRAFT_944 [Rasamsonia byssochlamydoides]|uniref:uncharacterized protein n=1 Tax=Rasamsonia byssochlamydoides TaxID=89139 RepID=UPI0037448C02
MADIICPSYVLSPIRTILEPLIVPALLLAYLPQYIQISRHGTAGISPRWILYLCLFSNAQLASRLANTKFSSAVECILYDGEIRGWQAFGVLLTYFQVGAQWLSAMLLLYFFVKFRSPTGDALYTALPTDPADASSVQGDEPSNETFAATSEMSSQRMTSVIATQALVFIIIAITSLVMPKVGKGRDIDLPAMLLWSMFRDIFYWLCIAMALTLVIGFCVFQVRDVMRARHDTGSILSLALQVIVLLALALLQAFRPAYPETASRWRALVWYLQIGNVSVHYFIMSLGHAICLGLRIYYSWSADAENISESG